MQSRLSGGGAGFMRLSRNRWRAAARRAPAAANLIRSVLETTHDSSTQSSETEDIERYHKLTQAAGIAPE
jgi:hypothetical protein